MSSHREAPEISQDPVADNTDTYAFVSPDKPDTVTILTNYIPLEAAAGGPNFYEFGTDVLYAIYISNKGTALPDITYTFRFTTEVRDEYSFLYNFGPITSMHDKNFNRRQFYTVTKTVGHNGKPTIVGSGIASPPCNIGPHSTPNYPALAQAAVHKLHSGETVFAGQRNDGFFADLGAVFDLADVRPFQTLHIAPMAAAAGIDTLKSGINVHTIALQIPIKNLTRDGSVPKNPAAAAATIGIWGAASRRKMRLRGDVNAKHSESGPWVQVSRLGNPLFNELLVPVVHKDAWNRSEPHGDERYAHGVQHPELGRLLPKLYPGSFPNLQKLVTAQTPRADLVAILLTGLPAGLIDGFQNHTGKTMADMLRLNVAIPPTASPNPLGVLAGDLAGYPNGRRVADDVVTIAIRAVAGAAYPLVDKTFTPDTATGLVTQGVDTPPTGAAGSGDRFLANFPYLGEPYDGFDTPSAAQATAAAGGPPPASSTPLPVTPPGTVVPIAPLPVLPLVPGVTG